jgi:hypothetical protein
MAEDPAREPAHDEVLRAIDSVGAVLQAHLTAGHSPDPERGGMHGDAVRTETARAVQVLRHARERVAGQLAAGRLSAEGTADHDQQRIAVLTAAYQSLREDMQVRSAARFQFLGFVTAAAAVLAAGLGRLPAGTTLVLEILAAVLFAAGLATFWVSGRQQARISWRAAQIEAAINQALGGDKLLTWETDSQDRSFFDRYFLNLRP